ncbi:multiple C2 and transmembrane domain-containing protein 2 isoform X3 [Cyclopterus lumpus]|uniref:multiple C2 and transmembrane domain-containing protein 2 isoform X3 n=1 Tax=Cyclopterus lumpus TaxID=8103 RepID=UPI001486ECF2|nr:multiple C2 and transmembrane domain-containing protein 2 isoform X3 [Cyclopterus lumpus]
MDIKTKNFFDNLRLKTKLANLKKQGKKALPKRGKKLAHRRSISVPDLRSVLGEAFPADSALVSTPDETTSFGNAAGLSDTDSVASSLITDGPLYTDKLNDSVSESRLKVPTGRIDAALNRMSAPVGLNFYEEIDGMINVRSQNKVPEGLYAQVDKRPKGNAPRFTFDPIPAPSSVLTYSLSPSPERVESRSLSGEGTSGDAVHSGAVAAVLARASSMGDQINPFKEKSATSFEYRKPDSEKGTPPAIRVNAPAAPSLISDNLRTPVESADGTSLDSACGSTTEEQVSMPWTTDSEELDREPSSPFFMRDFTAEEALLEQAQSEEALEETTEMSSEPWDFFDENQDLLENPVMSAGPDVQAPDPSQRYLLSINLKQGRNLVIRDKRSGTSDAYVKLKLEGKQFYKSKVVYKTLNPRWNESFSYPLRDIEHAVDVRVYNKKRTADDFMGSSTIILNNLELYKTYEMELQLDDPKRKEDDMGVILVDVCLMFRDATIKRSPRWPQRKNKQNQAAASSRSTEAQRNPLKNQMWTGVLGITLVEGQDLPQHGHGDIYVRFRLGDQKHKSKNICIQAHPQWREQFDFNQFEDNQEPLQVEVYSKRGRKAEESWGMFEIDLLRLQLNERQLYTHVLDPGKGKLVLLVTLRPCWGVSISNIEAATLEKPDERDAILEKFSLKNSHKCVGEVGFLQVKVVKANDLAATDLNGKINAFCVVDLGNSKLQTHTIYKTPNPEWNKAFTFPIKDIHDVIEFTLLDENGDKAPNFLGKVAIPLLTVQNGQQICLFLKKEDLVNASKGTLTLGLEVIYNKVRAGIKSFQPKETQLMEENQKFSKKVLAQNICRVRKISTAVLYTLQYIKSCFQWESTQRSLIAFLIFLVTVWQWELFMLPLFLLLLIGWHYFQLTAGKASSNQDLVNMSMGEDEEEDEKEFGKRGLMDKIHMVQEVVLTVQNLLEDIANIGERIKNIFNWSIPFLSCLVCLVLFVTTSLLYFIPLRYIVLIWDAQRSGSCRGLLRSVWADVAEQSRGEA